MAPAAVQEVEQTIHQVCELEHQPSQKEVWMTSGRPEGKTDLGKPSQHLDLRWSRLRRHGLLWSNPIGCMTFTRAKHWAHHHERPALPSQQEHAQHLVLELEIQMANNSGLVVVLESSKTEVVEGEGTRTQLHQIDSQHGGVEMQHGPRKAKQLHCKHGQNPECK